MLDLSEIENIYLVPEPTDLRKSIDGCSTLVQYSNTLPSYTKTYSKREIRAILKEQK